MIQGVKKHTGLTTAICLSVLLFLSFAVWKNKTHGSFIRFIMDDYNTSLFIDSRGNC